MAKNMILAAAYSACNKKEKAAEYIKELAQDILSECGEGLFHSKFYDHPDQYKFDFYANPENR
jgi:hypothetical protein